MYSGSSLNLIASLLAFLFSLINLDVFSEIKKSCSFCFTDWQLLSRAQIIEVSSSSTAFSISSGVVRSPISIDFSSLRNFCQFALSSLWTAFVRAFSTSWEFNLICTGRWSLPTSPLTGMSPPPPQDIFKNKALNHVICAFWRYSKGWQTATRVALPYGWPTGSLVELTLNVQLVHLLSSSCCWAQIVVELLSS